ncbi:MAG: CPBP family intramembrane glutamic endopeptidase [Dehalococcoidia bacterium]
MITNAGAAEIGPPLRDAGRLPRLWSVREVAAGIAVAVFGSIAIILATGAVLVVIHGVEGRPARIAGAIAAIGLEALLGGWVALRARTRGISWSELGFVQPLRWGPLWIAWGGSYAILVGYALALEALRMLGVDTSALARGNQLPIDASDGGAVLLMLGVAVVALAPLCEELFFRAFVFRGLRGYWLLGPSMLLSGLMFGLFHFNISVLLPFTLIGVLFAWAYEASGSVYTSIAAHGAVNALSFTLTVLLASMQGARALAAS